MTQIKFTCENIQQLDEIAQQILEYRPGEKIYLISGKMGAGKTTFIKSMCKILNVVDVVNSPTFSIINEYKTLGGDRIFHFDLYRIKSAVELLDIGYEEYIDSGDFCLIEWPELANGLMPSSFVMINIEVEEDSGTRLINIS